MSVKTLRIAAAAGALVALAGCGAPMTKPSAEPVVPPATTRPASPAASPTPAVSTSTPAAPASTAPGGTTATAPTPAASTSTRPAPVSSAPSSTSASGAPSSAPPAASHTPAPAETPAVRTTLRPGDRGADVRALQQSLSDQGFWLGQVDGIWGGLTTQAVYAAQKAAGLGRDGIAGPATRGALARGIRVTTSFQGDGVVIDLSRQLLKVVRGGRVALVLNTSTGNGETYVSGGETRIARTPTGTFTVSRVVDGPDDGPLGALWRPRYFYGGYAVHGSPSIPPYPASHGCARVSNAAMDMIWARGLMPIGSRVWVA